MLLPPTMALSFSSLPAVLLGLAVAWYAGSTAYHWRRLRHVPGPRLASFSYLWLARSSYGGRQYDDYLDLDRRYGPVVRIGPNEVLTSDAEALRRMSAATATADGYAKGAWVDGNRFNPYERTLFMTRDPRAHDAYKARVAPAYGGRETPALEAAVDEQVGRLLGLVRRKYAGSSLEDDGGRFVPLPLIDVVGHFTLDVISRIALGKEFGCLAADADVVGFYRAVGDHLPVMNLTSDVPWVRAVMYSPLFLRLFGPRETDKMGLGRLMKLTNDFVRSRFANKDDPTQDMLGSFMRHGLTQGQCEAEALFMFVAGSDTTAAVLRLTLFHVAACPRVYGRLKREIAAAVASGRAPSEAATASDDDDSSSGGKIISLAEARALPYLQAVVYEGLRARPVTTGQQAKTVPAGGDTVRGVFLPAGTSVAANPAALLRDPALFGPDPDVFRPERFLPFSSSSGDPNARDPADMRRDVELNFGYGRYMCAGKPVAFLELNKVIFELMRHFDWQLLDPQNPLQTENYNLFRDTGLRMRVTAAAPVPAAA